jgi:hypothetical protein
MNIFQEVVRELNEKPVRHVYTNCTGELVHNTGHHKRTYSLSESFKKCIDIDNGNIHYKIRAKKSL